MKLSVFYIFFLFFLPITNIECFVSESTVYTYSYIEKQQKNTMHWRDHSNHIQLPYERPNRCIQKKSSKKKHPSSLKLRRDSSKKSKQRKQSVQSHQQAAYPKTAQDKQQSQQLCKQIEANFQAQYHEFKQYCEYEYGECSEDFYAVLNRNDRLEKRFSALQNIEHTGAHYTHYNHVLTPETVNHLRAFGYDVDLYKFCYGNQIQQIIHEDCITLLQEASTIPASSMFYSRVPAITDCIDAARAYNQGADCVKACTIQDFCWSLLQYGKAVAEGVAWGAVGAVQDCLQHPLHTAACVIIPEGVLVYQLSKVLVNVADIGATYLLDKEKGKRKLHDYIAPVTQIIHALQNKQLSGPEIVRGTTQLAIHWKAQSKLLNGLSKLYTTSKIKLEQFIKENPFSTPEQYMTTPEGVLLRASSMDNHNTKNLKRLSLSNEKPNHIKFDFSNTAARHMEEAGRQIPIYILDAIIKNPLHVLKDPRQATEALMYYAQIWKNGKLYNVEVLYDNTANRILHFLYRKESLGPLPEIK